ncbi:hypothetical protein V8G54_036585 [Vigna mungo]|uniref:Uncharacterized protein n=1 Tax=Vigna mungo TaxID=3915 RepID=A0AAQ3MHK5_VIGMU
MNRRKLCIRFLGLLEGASVAKVEEIVDAVGVDSNGTVLRRRRRFGIRLFAVICHLPLLLCSAPFFLRNFANAVCAFSLFAIFPRNYFSLFLFLLLKFSSFLITTTKSLFYKH